VSLLAAGALLASEARPLQGTVLAAPAPHILFITVSGVKSAVGHIRADVCTEREFLKDCRYTGAAPAVRGVTTVLIAGLPPGRYAVQAYHDKNDNHEADRNIVGVPTEGVGFSNGVKIRLRAPRFADAAFDYGGGDQAISLRLQHFID
jgi:uncharacterized protein (DUF2141 family)